MGSSDDLAALRALRCSECGRVDPGDERGWKLYLDCDDELVPFCPECSEREFEA